MGWGRRRQGSEPQIRESLLNPTRYIDRTKERT
jgi:hypothetical protein